MIHSLSVLIFASVLIAAPVPKVDGVKPEQFTERRIQLLRDSRVQKELGLSAEQRIALIDHFEAVDEAYPSDIPGGPSVSAPTPPSTRPPATPPPRPAA